MSDYVNAYRKAVRYGRSDLLDHAAAALSTVDHTALWSFADHLEESEFASNPWVPELRKFLNQHPDDTNSDQLSALLDTTPHSATKRNSVSPSGKQRYDHFELTPDWTLNLGNDWASSRSAAESNEPLLPTYYKDYNSGQWTKEARLRRERRSSNRWRDSTGRTRYIVRKESPIEPQQVVQELFEAGGIGNVIHAVLGHHYFAPGSNVHLK